MLEPALGGDRTDQRRPARPKLTIVTPVFNEMGNFNAYVKEVWRHLLSQSDIDVHVLFVDDGSSDESWSRIEEIAANSPRFSGLRLSRNFGAHTALAAGFDHVGADSDIVAVLACDLQDPPETILAFVEAWRGGADIVWGARRNRDDQAWRRAASSLLQSTLRHAMPPASKFQTGSFLLMDRRVLQCFAQYREHSRATFALVAWTGFDQAIVEYDRKPRTAGKSGWSFSRMLNTAFDIYIGFTPIPAKLLTGVGFTVFGLSLVAIAYLVSDYLLHDVQPGWTGIMTTLMFLFGILFVMLGILAEYMYRIFLETKARPLYFIAYQTPAHAVSPRNETATDA